MALIHADRATAKRILGGDEAAFRELFDGSFPKLYRFALARLDGNRNDACEVVQVTFCRVFERLETYRGEASLFAWTCQICRHAIADHRRVHRREWERSAPVGDDDSIQGFLEALSAPAADEPEALADRADLIRLVHAALDSLPERYGDVLEWKYIDGLTVAEISGRLAVSTKAAESSLTRARVAFREAIVAMEAAHV